MTGTLDGTGLDPAVAIIGIGCRFPGGASSPEAFWRLLRDGVDAIGELPADRYDLAPLFDPDPSTPGKLYVRWGGFVDGIDQFDAAFFGLSPREAVHIDPQHRLLLEVAWEAFEDGGLPAERLAGSRTGVFVGISTHDYGDIQTYPGNRSQIDSHSNSGTATSIAANRLSYLFDLRGPSLTVDTACSSALTAVHLACQSLRSGESELAVVGAVQLLLTPESTIGFCKASMLSPDGRCKAFDASANGYVRSEGAGVVLLKRLDAAIRDGDRVYAVIAGSAINQDGRTTGMTVPSPVAHEAMIRTALGRAGLRPADVQYVEAHGTGTAVGDPIEASALGAVFAPGRRADDRLAIGSVKTNIGHLEAASGMAGLIKATLALHHGQLPPSLHFHTGNPAIDFEGHRLRVVAALEAWPATGGLATAGVNSFGFGGANAHVVLQRPAAGDSAETGRAGAPRSEMLTLSARSPEALAATAATALAWLANGSRDTSLESMCRYAARRRGHSDHRLAVVAGSREELVEGLDAFAAGEQRANVIRGRSPTTGAGKLAFVFCGMGPQWWGMGRQLQATEPAFRRTLERCDAALRGLAEWSLLEELARDEATSRVGEAELAQVTNCAMQLALVALWEQWGVRPDAVVGHSAGEMGAAYAAGVLDLESAILLSYHRGRLQARATGKGRMLAVGLSPEEGEALIAGYVGRASLAAVNSPTSLTLSGDADALDEILASLQARQVFARMLPVAVPYHSRHMDPIEGELRTSLERLKLVPGTVPFVSVVTGTEVEGTELDGAYWWRNVRQPVRFAAGIQHLIAAGYRTFLEIGPHPVLTQSINECLAASGTTGTVLPSVRRTEDERTIMLRSLAALHVIGRPVAWAGVYGGAGSHVSLPHYPWQRERHWFVSQAERDDGLASPAGGGSAHPLLGRRLRVVRPLWEAALDDGRLTWLDDHRLHGATVFPGAAYAEIGLALSGERHGEPRRGIRDLQFHKALFLPARDQVLLQTTLDADRDRFEIHGAIRGDAPQWTLHASGAVAAAPPAAAPTVDLDAVRARCTREIAHDACYESFAARGLEYGPAFRGIARLWQGEGEALAEVTLPEGVPGAGDGLLHPALLDAAFQVLVVAVTSGREGITDARRTFLPIRIAALDVYAPPGATVWVRTRLVERDDHEVAGDVDILDANGHVLVETRGLRCRLLEAAGAAAESLDDWLYEYRWEPSAWPGSDVVPERSLLTPDWMDRLEPVRRDIPELSRTLGWGGYYAEVEPRLNAIAAQFAVRAFRDLGWALAAGDRRSLAALAASLRIAPAQHLLLGALVKMLVADGVLRESGDAFDVIRSPRDVAPEELAAQLVAERPLYATDVALLTRCGRQLAQVLTGALDAREILFSDEALELLTTFYRDAPPSRFYNTLVGRAVGAVAADRRNGRPLRVLELGAGTGGTTAYVLDQLSGAVEYHFTDVSPLFTERAKVRFAASPAVQVRTLDIERESESQGFSPHSFDMVVAANVLHATADLAHTLERVKTLLSPGGLVVLLEITRRPPWLDVIFGLTDGWWKFADRARRADHPLLDAAQWRTLFGETGFARVETVADAGQGDQSGQSVLLAQLGEVEAAPQPARARRPWLLCSDGGGVADRLAAELGRAVRECMLVPGGALPSNLGERAAGGFEGIVYLAGLDAPSGEDVPAQVLVDGQAAACAGVVDLLRVLDAAGVKSGSLRIVTAGAQQTEDASVPLSIAQSALWGLGRVIMKERPDLHCRMIDLGPAVDAEDVRTLARELCSGDDEEEVSLRAGRRYVRRLRRLEAAAGTTGAVERVAGPDDAFRAEIDVPGALETIVLREATRREPRPDEVEVRIEASGVNFRDVMLGMGMLPALASEGTFGSGQLGLDCAGTVVACGSEVHDVAPGAEVLGIAPGTFGSHATTRGALLARKPEGLEWAQAAAIPCAFVTAYYALVYLARIRAGERVLIHAATGGVGLAALQIAHEAGAEVFATAGSPAKREYLVGLGVRHVYDSRSLEFAEQILRDTDARGVDIVLNSLAGDAIAKGISTLAPFGRFVEIGKRDIYQDSRIGLLPFRANLSFFAVDLDRLCSERPALAGELLRTVVGKFADGSYQPLPQRVFPLSETGEAVRFMARAKHIGKVVVVRTAEDVNIRASKAGAPLARKDGSYLITGGLGGFGLAVAGALAREGAGTLVLMGRSAPGVEADRLVEELRAGGTRVEVMLGDVADESDLARVLGRIRAELPPLRGVVHAAMVLDDAPLAQLDAPRFRTALAPKVGGAWNLHRQTAGDALDFFVLFSSIAALLGNPLQANYAAANAVLDALAHHRRALGRPALAVDWGVLANVGYVSHHPDIADYLERQGYLSFTSAQALDALGALMRRDCTHVMAARIDWARWATSSPAAAASPRLLHFAPSAAQRSGPAAGDRGSVVSLLRAAAAAERDGILESYLRAKVGKVLGMAPAKLEAERPLTEMGFDSLIAVELMTALKMDLGVELPVVKLLQGASLASLGRLVLEHLALPDAPANGRATAVPEPPRPEPVAEPLCADTPAPAAAGAPIPVAAVVPEPRIARVVAAAAGPPPVPPNGAAPARARVDYGALDYTRWSRRQRLVRGAITTGFRLVADVRVEGREHFPDHGPFIIATNHLSMADVPAVLTVLSRPTILMAADWLRSSRLLDWFLGDVGNAIYVRRGEGDREALELGLTVLRSGGVLGLAPEGTRSRNGALGAGHSGIAHLATRAGVPVVPVVAWGQEKLGSQLRRLRRSPVCIRVGPPISFPPGEVTAAELLAYTSQVMQAIATLLPPEYRGVYAVDAPEEPEPVPIS